MTHFRFVYKHTAKPPWFGLSRLAALFATVDGVNRRRIRPGSIYLLVYHTKVYLLDVLGPADRINRPIPAPGPFRPSLWSSTKSNGFPARNAGPARKE